MKKKIFLNGKKTENNFAIFYSLFEPGGGGRGKVLQRFTGIRSVMLGKYSESSSSPGEL